jgi:hypothetical protein
MCVFRSSGLEGINVLENLNIYLGSHISLIRTLKHFVFDLAV